MDPDPIFTAFTALDRLALALIVGLCGAWLWLLRRQDDPVAAAPAMSRLFAIALVTLVITSLAELMFRTAVLADVGVMEAWPHLSRVVTQTDYGQFWLLRAGVVAVLALLWLWQRDPPLEGLRGIAALAALLLVFVISTTGHAGEDGNFTLMNINNTLHITAGMLWGGTVVVYAVTILPDLRRGTVLPEAIAETAARLSSLAGAALAVVLATGLYNAWLHVTAWDALWTTDYGQTLVIKLVFVAAMMGVGAYNRFFLVPAIEAWATPPQFSATADGPSRRFLYLLRTDLILFTLILIAAATLGNTTPARHLIG